MMRMDIKNKFPELIHFIENPKGYELLYSKEDSVHNEYALDVEEAKEIIKFIEDLKKENEKLKKQLPEKRKEDYHIYDIFELMYYYDEFEYVTVIMVDNNIIRFDDLDKFVDWYLSLRKKEDEV